MSLIKIDGLNVLTAYLHNLDEGVAFYKDILGFEETKNMEPGVLMQHPEAEIMLYLEGDRQRRESATENFNHISFCLNAANGVKDAKEKLEKAGVEIFMEYGEFDGEFAGIQFCDPSGNVIEIAGQP
jgi:predicted enzyme related to lactoylglutathione lyase